MDSFQYGRFLSNPGPGEEVVITGLSGQYPLSKNIDEFCNNLLNGKYLGTKTRWNFTHPDLPKLACNLDDLDKFDAGFFGVHYRQADIMDFLMKKSLETAIEAIIDAGMHPSELENTRTGVYVCACNSEQESYVLKSITKSQQFALTGYLRSLLAHRLSYYLKIKGPSFIADTACSSSFNALETAFKAIRNGQCDNAIVAGINICAHPLTTIQFRKLGVTSINGICKVFDEDADGYVRSEASVSLFLQKAKNARRIHAQIIYAKVNDDGFKNEGITFPSSKMQEQLMKEVYHEIGISPSELSYLEAHGTGTKVGDPAEVEAIDNAVAKQRQKAILIGSVKCNIGHSEPVSGLCSLSKVIFAFETGLIPPNINIKKIKSSLSGVSEGRIKIVQDHKELNDEEAIVGINNFGFGGNNVHVVVRRFKKAKYGKHFPEDDLPRLVCVSGRTEKAVLTILNALNSKSLDSEYIALLHHVFKINFETHLYRGFAIITKNGPIKNSSKLYKQKIPFIVFFGKLDNSYKSVGKCFLNFPIFKNTLLNINKHLMTKGINVIDLIVKRQDNIEYDLLGSIIVQIGIVKVLKSLEAYPDSVYGESVGKIAVKYYYETITLEEAVETAFEFVKSEKKDFSIEKIISELKSTITKRESRYFFKQNTETNGTDYFREDDSVNSRAIAKNGKILNISDRPLLDNDTTLINDGTVKFLEFLGSLYESGHNPQLYNLYPEVKFPVSRETPNISPLIEWNHNQSWYTYNFEDSNKTSIKELDFRIFNSSEECKYMTGHVIDGRNLIPAAEYLRMAWEVYAKSLLKEVHLIPVIFKNCKFIKAVVLPTDSDGIILRVSYHPDSGKFQVQEGESLVVTGVISSMANNESQKVHLDCPEYEKKDSTLVMKQDEIYRELYLRGYNYSGLFKGIIECDLKPSVGLIQWENNWTTFIDKMLQIKIFQLDTRLLYVPVGLDKLIIDPFEHLRQTNNENEAILPVHVFKECDVIKSGGIEIRGLKAKSIAKRKPRLEPVLEKHVFIPNEDYSSLITSIRTNVQIVLENNLDKNFRAVEIIDDSINCENDFLLPLVSQILEDVPSIKPDLIISSKKRFDKIPGITFENYTFTVSSNLSLIVGYEILEKGNYTQILSALAENGFVLSKEKENFVPKKDENIEIVTQYITENEKIILFKKAKTLQTIKYVEITSDNFKWLSKLQQILKEEPNVFIYSQNRELDGIMGFVNCIRQEPGGDKVKCLFITGNAPKFDPQHPLYQNQIKKNLAVNIYKDSKWGTYRHLPLEDVKETKGEHFFVNTTTRGDLSSLQWIKGPLTSNTILQKEEVLIKNYYAALNFRDVMIASGRITLDAFSTKRIEQDGCLGLEFAGKYKNDKRVAGMTMKSGLSTLLIADKNFMWNVPDSWTLEEAATVSVVYYTVLYSLLKVTVVKPGTSILIHSGTGGVGLAALNVCLYYGCEIFVTVGTQEKRDFLNKHFPQIPNSHIGNSRDTSFEKMIKSETKGRGVDIVLNSLTEEKLLASVRSLARGGNFVEIGKYDLANNTALSLLLFEKNITYHGVMLDKIDTIESKQWMVKKMEEGIKLGYVKPLPTTVFKQDEIETAFRYMTTGKHIGKVLIKIRKEESETSPSVFKGIPRFSCDNEKSFVIIGGLGGLGLELTDWLILKGAKKIVLVTSSGVKNGYQSQRIKIWKSYGVTVHISKANIATKEGCLQLINEANSLGPIDGIFNLAVILKDALFEDQTEDQFEVSFAPKANATIILDQISRKLCPTLKHFVVFSSVSCGRGNAGQTNYGMANSVMERVCEKRKQEGLPALAIQWGAIGDVGLVAKMQKENRELVIGGTLQQKVSSCLEVLDLFLNQDNPVVSSMVVAEKTSRNYDSGSPVDAVASILGIKDLKTISQHTTLAELGLDSMMGTEVIQVLEKNFEIYVSTKDVRSLTFAKLTEMEDNKKVANKEECTEKSVQGTNLLLQYLPEIRSNEAKIIKLPSLVDDKTAAKTVFLFCGIEGVFRPLEKVTTNLKAHIFGVQYNYNNPEDTIEEYAKAILARIKNRITKDKIFHIIGYSFGVLVALEVVHLLEKDGYFGNIVAIDGSPKYSVAAVKQFMPEETEAEIQTSLLLKIMAMVLPLDVITQNKDNLLKCNNFDERIDLLLSLIPASESKNLLEKQGAITIYKRFKAVLNYKFVHEKIKSNLNLIKAKYPMITEIENDYQLSEVCDLPVQVHTIEGDHASMLSQSQLVDIINGILN